jgi:tetratricopeptide (TPR) repeat protein
MSISRKDLARTGLLILLAIFLVFNNVFAQVNEREYLNKGTEYFKNDQIDEAISAFTKAIELNPDNAPSYNCRADTYYSKKEYNKARNDATKAQELGFTVDPRLLESLNKQK